MKVWYPNSKFKKKLYRITKPIQHTVLPIETKHCIDCGINIRKSKKRSPECSVNAIKDNYRKKDIIKRIRIKQNELIGKLLDNAPTLDHIIPISKGGSHTYLNVQLLCRKCNCKVKRDTIISFPILETVPGVCLKL